MAGGFLDTSNPQSNPLEEPISGLDAFWLAEARRPVAPEVPHNSLEQFWLDERDREVSNVLLMYKAAERFDPDLYARARAAGGTAVPTDTAARNIDQVESLATLNRMREILVSNPRIRAWALTDAEAISLIKVDELEKISSLGWMFQASGQAFRAGQEDVEEGRLRWAQIWGTATPEQTARAQALTEREARDFGADGWWDKALTGVMRSIPQIFTSVPSAIERATPGMVIGAGVGGAVGSVVPGLGTLAGASAGVMHGLRAGATVGFIEDQFKIQAGLAYSEFLQFRDENGQPLEPEVARVAALAAGLPMALLDAFSLSRLASVIPGVDKVGGLIGVASMKAALRNPTFRAALGNFGKNLLGAGATEITTEVLQEMTQLVAGELAKAASDGEFAAAEPSVYIQRARDAFIQSAQVMSVVGPLISSPALVGDLNTARRSAVDSLRMSREAAVLVDNPAVVRAPDKVAAAIDAMAKGTNDETVFIPAKELMELYQSLEEDVYTAGAAIPGWQNTVNQALATSGDVKLTIGQFFGHLVKDPRDNPLLDLARFDPNNFTKSDVQEFIDRYNAMLEGAKPDVKAVPAAERGAVEKDLEAKFVAAGTVPENAKVFADVYGSFFNVMADRANVNPEELYAQALKQVQRSDLTELQEGDLAQERKGSIRFTEGGAIISLFEKADLSTLAHEGGHLFLNEFQKLAKVNKSLSDDFEVISKEFGITTAEISRESHEAFAKAFEAYLLEGKAPSEKLRTAFQRLRSWLLQVYRSIRRLGGPVSDDIRQVFDRMLATDAQIAEQSRLKEFDARTAEELGLTPEEYAPYIAAVEASREKARARMQNQYVGRSIRNLKGWMGDIYQQVRNDVRAELKASTDRQIVQRMQALGIRINFSRFKSLFGANAADLFPHQAFGVKGQQDPEIVASALGYVSAADMVDRVTSLRPLEVEVTARAKAIMRQRYEQDTERADVVAAMATQAMFNDSRTVVLATELKALRKQGQQPDQPNPTREAQRIAAATIQERTVGDVIGDRVTLATYRKAAREADIAVAEGDFVAAADWKRKQLFAHEYMKLIIETRDLVEAIRRKALRFTRVVPKDIFPNYAAQIAALVERYEFVKVTKRVIKRRQSLAAFIQKEAADGEVSVIPDYLLEDATAVNYTQLTVEELEGFSDAVDNLEHLGRLKNRLYEKGKAREQADVLAEVVASLSQNQLKPDTVANTKQPKALSFSQMYAELLMTEKVINDLDRGNANGVMGRLVLQPFVNAEVEEHALSKLYANKLVTMFKDLNPSYMSERFEIKTHPAISGKPFTLAKEGIIVAALNTGLDINRNRLMQGHKWTPTNLDEILSKMNKTDWEVVQSIWNLMDELFNKLDQLQVKLTGVRQRRPPLRSFTNEHGTWTGGMYPTLVSPLDTHNPSYTDGTTQYPNKDLLLATKWPLMRLPTSPDPVNLELSVVAQWVDKTIHALAYRQPLKQARKILQDLTVRDLIIRSESRAIYDNFEPWLRSMAAGRTVDDPGVRGWYAVARKIRANTSLMALGYSLRTVLIQPLGLLNGFSHVKSRFMAQGLMDSVKAPFTSYNFMISNSPAMSIRGSTIERDIMSAYKTHISSSRLGRARDDVVKFAYHGIIGADRAVVVPTWMGAYYEHLASNKGDTEGAIQHADRVIRLSQGSGGSKDLSAVARSNPILQLFTMFYTFYSALFNHLATLTRGTKRAIMQGNLEQLPRLAAQWTFSLLIPALLADWIFAGGPDEDEGFVPWAVKSVALYGLTTIPFGRDAVGFLGEGFTLTASPIAQMLKSFADLASNLAKLVTGDELDPRVTTKNVLESFGYGFGLPMKPLVVGVDNVWYHLEQGDFSLVDLIWRRPRE